MEEGNRFLVQEMEDLEYHPLEEIKYEDLLIYQTWIDEQKKIIESIFK
jgi:hypothetical protein